MEIDLMFEDWQKKIKNDLGREKWITVYSHNEDESEIRSFYCALVPDEIVSKVLDNPSWDLLKGEGFPGFIEYFDTNETKYFRFGDENGIEPLVFCRDFPGTRKPYEEISEEFRHYHNLFHDIENNRYIKIDSGGDEDDVIIVKEDEIKIKLIYIKQFLSVKKMHLAIYFDLDRYSYTSLEELGIKETSKMVKENNYIYQINFFRDRVSHRNIQRKSFSTLVGKKLISGLKDYRPESWGDRRDKEYMDFIIDLDEEGREVCHSCDPDKLDYPGATHYITPVFFKKEVLTKYYAYPDKYSVEDNYIRCKGSWGLEMDNNHNKYVIVLLRDLGLCLSTKEQMYWRSFNVPPDGHFSSSTFKRWIQGRFSDPERNDLLFKYKFESFQEEWFEKRGWHLFKPLAENDKHFYQSLRIPLTNDQSEFDQQVLALAKILIDSINEKELEKLILVEKNDKSITKFEKFLKSNRLIDCDRHVGFLRGLQNLRSSGVVHRKSENYERTKEVFHIEGRDLTIVFDEILENSILLLDYLENRLL